MDILWAAKATAFLGGIFDPKKAGAIERFIVRLVMKQKGYICSIDKAKIEQFVTNLKR